LKHPNETLEMKHLKHVYETLEKNPWKHLKIITDIRNIQIKHLQHSVKHM
jgi:hypothetical protein